MTKQSIEWKAAHIFGAALLITLFSSFGSVTPAVAATCEYGELADGTCKCEASADGLAKSIKDAGAQRKLKVLTAITDGYVEFNKAQKKNPEKNIQGKVEDIFCLSKFDTAFDQIGTTINSILMSVLKGLLDQILAVPCTLGTAVTDAIDTTLQNAFDKICIPLSIPDVSLSLPSVERKPCNSAISGSSLIKLKQSPQYEYQSAPDLYKTLPASIFPGQDGRT